MLAALLSGFYIRYRLSEAEGERASAFATGVIESVWVASGVFGLTLGAFIGGHLGGRAGAGFGLLICGAIGAWVAIRYSIPICDRIVRWFLSR